jgi:flagellar assembly protein FliH
MADSTPFQSSFRASRQAFQSLFDARNGAQGFVARSPRQLEDLEPQTTPALIVPTPEQVLGVAHDEAAQILAAARQQAQQLAEQAATEAYEQAATIFQQATADLLQTLEAQLPIFLQRLEHESAILLTDILRRILRERFTDDPEAIVPVVRQALQKLAESSRVQVMVAPQHEEPLRHAYKDLLAILADQARLEIVVSEEAEPFGCVAHGDHGSVDARLERRLQAIEQVVQDTITDAEAA